jgi:DNA invertase Pin-like site-specific DNA recombinase
MDTQNEPKPKPAVSYIRVSTAKQGQSGLGLEAQRSSVATFAKAYGYEIVTEYLEVESGKNDARPKLQKALAHAKKIDACLVIAKLDRLARSVSFIARIMDANTDFRAVDMPDASKFVLQIMAAVGEQEARACSERTKAALKAAKERGVLLGGARPECRNNLPKDAHQKGAATNKARAIKAYVDVLPKIVSLKAQGLSLRAIAASLNVDGHITSEGKDWGPSQVSRALARAA